MLVRRSMRRTTAGISLTTGLRTLHCPVCCGGTGVAGVWTFSFSRHQENPLIPAVDTTDTPGSLRLQLIYLDDEPLATTTQIEKRRGELGGDPGVGETLLSTPLRTIIPWRDW